MIAVQVAEGCIINQLQQINRLKDSSHGVAPAALSSGIVIHRWVNKDHSKFLPSTHTSTKQAHLVGGILDGLMSR